MEDYQWGTWVGREGEKVQRISSINGRQKTDRGFSIGTVEAEELIYMTHGHELKGGNEGGRARQYFPSHCTISFSF